MNDVALIGDKTLSLLTRDINSRLQQKNSKWHALDVGYNTWMVAPLDLQGPLYEAGTTAWGFVLSPRILDQADIETQIEGCLDRLSGLAKPPTVLFSNLFVDPITAAPLSTNLERHGLGARINERLRAFSEKHSWFFVVDHLSLAIQHGVTSLHDPRFEAAGQLYYSPLGTRLVGELWARALRCLECPPKKVCVVDLDNTLWGGILGEDGAAGLQMGDSGAGYAYRKFQRGLLQLRAEGILLAVCSKNNRDDALSVLREHPDCLLRPDHFAHVEIGWEPKSEGLSSIARTLGLGMDSLVFIDDSPVEREEITRLQPAVAVFPFPDDPMRLSQALHDYPGFDALRRTQEDRQRAESYRQEAARRVGIEAAVTPAEFFRSLELRLSIFSARAENLDRLHQLIMKTNQFNLTGERISGPEFRQLAADEAYLVLGLRVADRFGDSGVTGLAIVERNSWTIRNFLLSCRVIGRTVEFGFLSWLAERARTAGTDALTFRFSETGRNQVALKFLQTAAPAGQEKGTWIVDCRPQSQLPSHYVSIDEQGVSS